MNEKENIIQDKDLANDERISRFMQGLMEADEEDAFQIELKNNEELRNQAIAQARLVKGMKQVDEELKEKEQRLLDGQIPSEDDEEDEEYPEDE
jgi:ethanolamine utilization protein EutP (predicted NTPase)